MLLKYFYDNDLAQASYFIACPDGGVALVIDPARNIEPYLELARERGLKIIGAAETHIHADFVSGGRELAAATGGTLYISGHGGEFGYQVEDAGVEVQKVFEGDTIKVGGVQLDVLHTPGHTPEHISYLVTAAGMDKPFAIFSGDCLFVGDMGRPDLLETAVGVVGSKETGAKQQFASMQRLKTMSDYLQVLPGHGAGSACGKALGDVPSTTLGYEKLFNPAFQFEDEAAFVAWLLADQPPAPHYFAQMKKVNQRGAELLTTLAYPRPIVYDSEIDHAANGQLIDTRPRGAFASAHIPGSINIPSDQSSFVTWMGWLVDYDVPLTIVVDEPHLSQMVTRLRAIGIDRIAGYVRTETAMRYKFITRQVSPETAANMQQDGALIIDVRSEADYQDEHIPGALWMFMGDVEDRLAEIPRDRTVIMQCASGNRSQIMTSLLQKHQFNNVLNLDGGLGAWKKAGLPVERYN